MLVHTFSGLQLDEASEPHLSYLAILWTASPREPLPNSAASLLLRRNDNMNIPVYGLIAAGSYAHTLFCVPCRHEAACKKMLHTIYCYRLG